MVWEYEKFRGDDAIYAFCPKCKFHHNPSKMVTGEDGRLTTEIQYQYNYCPICGEYLYNDIGTVDVTWDERNIEELYDIE
jgi:hypothetical protein